MRQISMALVVAGFLASSVEADEASKEAPKVVLKSPDGKKTYDLSQLTADGPVLVRLTCACSGCDQELPYFQKLQAAYDAKGLKTLAVFQESPETTSEYAAKKELKFLYAADPKGELWKTFDTKAMPTNILIGKGGRVIKVDAGCKKDGTNAQLLSGEIAKILKTSEAKIADATADPKK